ncbi:MAG: acylphosphatase [Candidatus Cloacimonetes bacterium]|nr:acylphosphatase [Candidatus Cloacimonadota bacterium]
MKKLHIIIKGIVQGVAFRYFTTYNARQYNLYGYVKNLYNGEVEIKVQGDAENLEPFIDKIKLGPPSARVDNIIIEEDPEQTEYDSFEIVY